MVHQLELFVDSLPETCRCTDKLGVTLYRDKETAKLKRYLDPNHLNSVRWVVFDLDREDSGTAWMDANVPPPNFMATNPANGHAHYFYALKTPVHWNHASSRKAQRLLAAVSVAMTHALEADTAYSHGLAKNPNHKDWPLVTARKDPYDLREMAGNLELPKKATDLRRKVEAVSYGRNCTLFDLVRKWAYSEARKPQGWFGYEFWADAVLRRALKVNAGFSVPLDEREVEGVARHIAAWVWDRLDQFGPEGFRRWQAAMGRRSGRARAAKARSKAEIVIAFKDTYPEATVREIAAKTGIPRNTVHRLLR
jgi:hypothetical protein